MSYILDALKKADKNRKKGELPTVHTVHEPVHLEEKRAVWPYVAAIVLLINGLFLIWWMQPWSKAPGPDAASAPESAQLPPDQPLPADDSSGSNVSRVRVPAAPVKIGEKRPFSPSASTSKRQDKEGGQRGPASMPVAEEGAADVSATAGMTESAEAESVASDEGQVQASDQDSAELSEDGAVDDSGQEESAQDDEEKAASDTTEGDEGAAETGEPSAEARIISPLTDRGGDDSAESDSEELDLTKIPFVYQLPGEIQQDLPEFHISFHSYSLKPSKRLVSINGRIMREGQVMEKEIKLERITPSGVVLQYKKRNFKLDV